MKSLISKIPIGLVWISVNTETGRPNRYITVYDMYGYRYIVNLTEARVALMSEITDLKIEYDFEEEGELW